MFEPHAFQRLAKRAATLLAALALVLALFNTGRIGIDWSSAAAAETAHAAHSQRDCAEHAAVIHAAAHAIDADVLGGHMLAHVDHHKGSSQPDPAPHYHTHPCCVAGVVTVLPAVESMRLPAAAGGHRLVGDNAARPERRAPEGPNEPPRTASLG